jgi:hypothetical protein
MIFLFLIVLINIFIFFSISFNPFISYSQIMMPPLPSPSSNPSFCCKNNINRSDVFPPMILITTEKLYEGINVLKVKILDDSPLKMKEMIYSVGKTNITTYLAKGLNKEYKALVKANFPTTKIKVTAIDLNGNSATVVKEIKVEKLLDSFISTITKFSFLKHLFFGR